MRDGRTTDDDDDGDEEDRKRQQRIKHGGGLDPWGGISNTLSLERNSEARAPHNIIIEGSSSGSLIPMINCLLRDF